MSSINSIDSDLLSLPTAGGRDLLVWTHVHARQPAELLRRAPPIQSLSREFAEGSIQNVSRDLNHFSVIVFADIDADRHPETDLPALNLKCDSNLPGSPAVGRPFNS
jgi:hypothetical protein